MLERPYRLSVGPYWLTLPGDAAVCAEVIGPRPGAYQRALTAWTVIIGRFQLMLHLDALHDLGDLERLIDQETKGNITPLVVNGVSGVTHGDYGPLRTWIDWWFKKGDTMLCACLHSNEFPRTAPSEDERVLHHAIIGSLRYCRDFPTEQAPSP